MWSFTHAVTRDHAIVILIISSLVSLCSGVIITRINAKKDKETHAFYVKQDFYIEYLVHRLRINVKRLAGHETTLNDELLQRMEILNAEMLIKADTALIREVSRLSYLASKTQDPEVLIHHVVKIVNQFRKQMHNKPLTIAEFKSFIEFM